MSTSAQKSQLVVLAAADGDTAAGNQDDSVASVKEQRSSVVPECSEAEAPPLDLESGGGNKAKSVAGKWERDCRICHLSLDEDDRGEECGADNEPIELGCSCKDDLAAAHRQCAETWFKIRGNRTCEICGSIAQNIPGSDEAESSRVDEVPTLQPFIQTSGPPRFWQGHRFLNFMLACVIFAFVVSWLFHFNAPS